MKSQKKCYNYSDYVEKLINNKCFIAMVYYERIIKVVANCYLDSKVYAFGFTTI